MRKKILQSGLFKAASLAAAPSLIMGAMPLLGYAPWGRTSMEVVVFFVVVYSVIHVLVALLVMLVSRNRKYFPTIMLGVLFGALAGLQASPPPVPSFLTRS